MREPKERCTAGQELWEEWHRAVVENQPTAEREKAARAYWTHRDECEVCSMIWDHITPGSGE